MWFQLMKIVLLVSLLSGAVAAQDIQPKQDCDPAYPDEDVCIPSPPPDLDCGDIEHKDFTVLQPDPHRFDGDKDGVGCESQPLLRNDLPRGTPHLNGQSKTG